MVYNNYSLLPDNSGVAGNGDDLERKLDLKALRECKGLTLKDIFTMTRISVVNLEAIENNDLHLLPAPVYAKTFIKTYAKALGVDSEDILQRYAEHLRSLNTAAREKPVEKPAGKIKIPLPALVGAIALLIICSLVLLSLALHDKTETDVRALMQPKQTAKVPDGANHQAAPAMNSQPPAQPEAVPAAAQRAAVPPAVLPQKSPSSATAAAPVPPAPAVASGNEIRKKAAASPASYRLSITAKELTWLKIVSDQDAPYEILLKPGEKIDRNASGQFLIDVGNAGGIDAEFQGNSLGSLGKSGEVVHLKLP